MAELFLQLLNMSINASLLVLAVVVLRSLMKKAPKWIMGILWAFVGIRLVCPISIESVLSLIPSAKPIETTPLSPVPPSVTTGIGAVDRNINNYIISYYESSAMPTEHTDSFMKILGIIWAVGAAAMLIYSAVSFLRLKKDVNESVTVEGNVRLCDRISTPFILGMIRPKIYIPSSVDGSDMQYILAHERAHLKRLDHIWKPVGFLLLSVYWFNPIIWIAYILLCKDIELACDERVLLQYGEEIKKSYSNALINCSVSRRKIAACPLAFGEVGVKERVKSVLSYKKPAFWIIIIALVACITTAVCLLTNPKTSNPMPDGYYTFSTKIYHAEKNSYIVQPYWKPMIVEMDKKENSVYIWNGEELLFGSRFCETELNDDNFNSLIKNKDKAVYGEEFEKLVKKNRTAWVSSEYTSSVDGNCPYMIFKQRNGKVYIAYAMFENGSPTEILTIHRLEKKENSESDSSSSKNYDSVEVLSIGSDDKNASIELTDVLYKSGDLMIELKWSNLSEDNLHRSEAFTLSRKAGEKWVTVEPHSQQSSNILSLPPSSSASVRSSAIPTSRYYVSNYYDISKGETYKLSAEYYFEHDTSRKFSAWVEFKIKDASVSPGQNAVQIIKKIEKKLSEADIAFEARENENGAYLSGDPTGLVISDGKGSIVFYTYKSSDEARKDALYVSEDGCSILKTKTGASVNVDYIYAPRWYLCDNLIVLYVGENPDVHNIIYSYCGTPFAGLDSSPLSKKEIKNIIDRTVSENLTTATAIEVFYSNSVCDYCFSSIRSQYVIVEYADGSTETVKEALEKGNIRISHLDEYGISYMKNLRSADWMSDVNSYKSALIKENLCSSDDFDGFAVESHIVLDTQENGNQTTEYMIVVYGEYVINSGNAVLKSGTFTPAALTLNETDGSYSLVEFWIPEDGDDYDKSIRSKFPKSIADEAINSQQYFNTLDEQNEQKALDYVRIIKQDN